RHRRDERPDAGPGARLLPPGPEPDATDRDPGQAGDRPRQRLRPGWRPGAGHGLPPAHRRRNRPDGPAGGEPGPDPRLRRYPAPAAALRPCPGPGAVPGRRPHRRRPRPATGPGDAGGPGRAAGRGRGRPGRQAGPGRAPGPARRARRSRDRRRGRPGHRPGLRDPGLRPCLPHPGPAGRHRRLPGAAHTAAPRPPRPNPPTRPHAGYPARPCVTEGQWVRRGQRLGVAEQAPGVDVHSPCAGQVTELREEDVPQWPGMRALHVLIRPEPPHDTVRLPALDWKQATPEALRARIHEAGLAGLGGAGFPTAGKLAAGRERLILNGAECEPWIACDDALLRAHAAEVVLGGRMLARAVGAGRIQLAVEDSMPAALAACREAITLHGEGEVELVVVPTIYPEGGERQLIFAVTGQEVPRGGLPRDIGVIVLNVATARAGWRAVAH